MKTIFLGTPALAVPFLEKLRSQSELLAAVTNPDQPAGRGYERKPSDVKKAALRLGLPVLQPEKAGDPVFLSTLKELAPEMGVVVAYGKLLPAAALQIPKYGFLNVHFSLLPAYRGAAPIQWTLINGEKETGVTLFWLDPGMDTGPVFSQKKIAIAEEDDTESLSRKLVIEGVQLLGAGLDRIARDGRSERPQEGLASKAPILTKEQGRIDWNQPAQRIVNHIRGMTPWPGAYTALHQAGREVRIKVLQARAAQGSGAEPPGTIVELDRGSGFVIKCGQDR